MSRATTPASNEPNAPGTYPASASNESNAWPTSALANLAPLGSSYGARPTTASRSPASVPISPGPLRPLSRISIGAATSPSSSRYGSPTSTTSPKLPIFTSAREESLGPVGHHSSSRGHLHRGRPDAASPGLSNQAHGARHKPLREQVVQEPVPYSVRGAERVELGRFRQGLWGPPSKQILWGPLSLEQSLRQMRPGSASRPATPGHDPAASAQSSSAKYAESAASAPPSRPSTATTGQAKGRPRSGGPAAVPPLLAPPSALESTSSHSRLPARTATTATATATTNGHGSSPQPPQADPPQTRSPQARSPQPSASLTSAISPAISTTLASAGTIVPLGGPHDSTPPPADPGDRLSQPKYLYDALRPPTSSASSMVGMTAATGKMANELAPVRLLRSSWVLKMAEQLQRAKARGNIKEVRQLALRRRQEMPNEAYLSAEECERLHPHGWAGQLRVAILAVSHCWRTNEQYVPLHPAFAQHTRPPAPSPSRSERRRGHRGHTP